MINNMLQVRDHYEDLITRKVKITLRKMIDEDRNVIVFEIC
jgi:ribosome maturation factor RimP